MINYKNLITRFAMTTTLALSTGAAFVSTAQAFGPSPRHFGFVSRDEYQSAKAAHLNHIREANAGKHSRGVRALGTLMNVTDPNGIQGRLEASIETDSNTSSALLKNIHITQATDLGLVTYVPTLAFPDEEAFQPEVIFNRPKYAGDTLEKAERQLRQAPPLFDRLQAVCQAFGYESVYFDQTGEPEYVKSTPLLTQKSFTLTRGIGNQRWHAKTYEVEFNYTFDRTVPFYCWDQSCDYLHASSYPAFETITIPTYTIDQVRCSSHSPQPQSQPEWSNFPVSGGIGGDLNLLDSPAFETGQIVLKGQAQGGEYFSGVRIPSWITKTGQVIMTAGDGTLVQGFTTVK